MQSHYAKYIKELKNFDMIEDENGFAIYGIMEEPPNKFCYIEDIYVIPEKRKEKIASSYADKIAQIAKQHGCNILLGSVVPSYKDSHYRMLVLLGYGFKLYSTQHDLIYFQKEI